MIDTGHDALLPPGYEPRDDEDYMNPLHLAYFKRLLLEWRDELLHDADLTLEHLHDGTSAIEMGDRATDEIGKAMELKTRDRARKLIYKIHAALDRVKDGSYGYCEATGDPIGLKRLKARPIATLSLKAQEAHERDEKMHAE